MIFIRKVSLKGNSKRWLFLSASFLILGVVGKAQTEEIPIYQGVAPGSESWTWTEGKTDNNNALKMVLTYNVSRPTLIPFDPDSSAKNGSAVIICMGGGLTVLPVERGEAIAKQFSDKGIMAFVLKYRLAHSTTNDPYTEVMMLYKDHPDVQEARIAPIRQLAQADLENAIMCLKEKAATLQIDPQRIGVVGISAGGKLTANLAYNYTAQTRPAFVGFLSIGLEEIKRAPLRDDTPPVFIALAANDEPERIAGSLEYFQEWTRSKHKAELHIYAQSTHFLTDFPARDWVIRLAEWMKALGFCDPKN